MRIAALAAIGTAALLLSACSSGGDEPTDQSPAPSASPTIVAGGETTEPNPSVGDTDDPLCAAAQQNIEDADALEAKTSELTELMQSPEFLASDDATVLNEWGDEMLLLATAGQDFYKVGVVETEGEEVYAYFVTLNDFVENYAKALAIAASEATSNAEFLTGVSTLFTEAEAVALAEAAPDAAMQVATYLGERCGITG